MFFNISARLKDGTAGPSGALRTCRRGAPRKSVLGVALGRRYAMVALPIALMLSSTLIGAAADWPTWRYDAGRSASSPDELPADLNLQWTLELPTPKACWPPTQYRILFDESYEPVVMGKTLFVPSMVRDNVTAYDTETGETKWCFYADGPVRFAPVAWNGALYFVSDDGHLYCLDAETGVLRWKFRGGPSEYRLLGNERLISMWPARGGPVLYDGTVYFAASVWPFMGVFVHALDAETGDVQWTNSGSGSDFILQPHSSPSFAGIAPQGYLAATEDKLLLAGGRSVPAAYDRATGKILYYHANTKYGGYKFFLGSDLFFNATLAYKVADGSMVGHLDASLVTGDSAIGVDEGGWIRARSYEPVMEEYVDRKGRKRQNAKFPVLSEVQKPVEKLFIKAGSKIYGGAPGLVAALTLPVSDDSAFWQAPIEGEPWSMLAADGKLFVVTTEGRIYCFGGKKTEPTVHRQTPDRASEKNDRWVAEASRILKKTDVRDGYCLLLGLGTGRLAEELVRQSNLHVIGIDTNVEKVDSLRRQYDAQGLYGKRIALLTGDFSSMPMSPYFASLVVSEDLETAGNGQGDVFAERLFHVLRPYGGLACFTMDRSARAAFTQTARTLNLPNAVITETGSETLLVREGALPGSAAWTHQYGDVSNTVCSKDARVKPPLGPLWFGGPSHADVLPRHGHGPPQQVIDGRLFIQGIQVLSARDVYTGRTLWRKELPDLNTFDMYYDKTYKPDPFDRTYNQVHIPGANQYGTNLIATPERLYLIREEVCLVLDPATGETLQEWTLPRELDVERPNWGYIGVYQDLLIAGAAPYHISIPRNSEDEPVVAQNHRFGKGSQHIVVMNRFSGEVLWHAKSKYNYRHNTIVAGNGTLFCVDSLSQPRRGVLKRRGIEFETQPTLQAFDILTGDERWSASENVFGTWLGYSEEHDILFEGGSGSGDRARDEAQQGMAAYRGSDGKVMWRNEERYNGPCILHHDRLITQTGGSNTSAPLAKAFNLLTGERVNSVHPLTGEPTPWSWIRFKGCNTAIASEHMLTFRSASAAYSNLSGELGTTTIGGFRSGCTSNLLAADGVLNAPDYTRTCTCAYQNQTSLALVHLPKDDPETPVVEGWSLNAYPPPKEATPVKRVGINFGAPGNRFDDNGTLWLEFPSVGGPSPDIPLWIESENAEPYRHHASRVAKGDANVPEGGFNWVTASGIQGSLDVTIRPFLQSGIYDETDRIDAFERNATTKQLAEKPESLEGNYEAPRTFTVKLFFAETQEIEPGDRRFDVFVQNKRVLDDFDIVEAAGGANRSVVREFKGIQIKDDLKIVASPSNADARYAPVLCGIEIATEG